MKTLKLTSLFILLSILSMGMGFPDLISEKDIAQMEQARIEKKKKASAKIGCPNAMQLAKHKSAKTVSKSELHQVRKNEQSIFMRATAVLHKLVLRFFDTASNLLLKNIVPAKKFISEECSSADLSKGSKLIILNRDTMYNQNFTCN